MIADGLRRPDEGQMAHVDAGWRQAAARSGQRLAATFGAA
jgi:hypothetical protein